MTDGLAERVSLVCLAVWAKLTERHITDSNSWPLDLASHPELAKYGAYSPAQKYSESDIKQIITHAGEVRSTIYRIED